MWSSIDHLSCLGLLSPCKIKSAFNHYWSNSLKLSGHQAAVTRVPYFTFNAAREELSSVLALVHGNGWYLLAQWSLTSLTTPGPHPIPWFTPTQVASWVENMQWHRALNTERTHAWLSSAVHLEIRNTFWIRALHFHFALGFANYVACPVPTLTPPKPPN